MVLYRAMKSEELLNIIHNKNISKPVTEGDNTFLYFDNIDYIHFFRFADHAFKLKKVYDMAIVAKYNIDDDIIPKYEYGFYSGIKTIYDSSLAHLHIPLPEIIMDRKLIDCSCIVDFASCINAGFFDDDVFMVRQPVQKNNILKRFRFQTWTRDQVYYEYIKRLLPTFNNDTDMLAYYLKTIDLEEELNKMRDIIKEEKTISYTI